MVIGRRAGSSVYSARPPSPEGVSTPIVANAGRYVDTGSLSINAPDSYNCMTATLVTALVIDAIRNSVSISIGASRPMSRHPTASR